MRAALLSPFLVSATGVGYERGAYLWVGGAELWAQLWGSWCLPFAWAATWRAMADRRFLWLAGALTAVSTGFYFETGYLAFLGVIVIALVAPGPLRGRLVTARGSS